MAEPILAVGTVVSISAAPPATQDQLGFEALTFTEIGEVTNLGESSASAEIVNRTPLKDGVVRKLKGSINYGAMNLEVGKDITDAGQILLSDGFDGSARNDIHSLKVVNSDSATTYYRGVIGSFAQQTGDANTVLGITSDFEIDTKPLDV